jgi:hypothetical protein
MEWKKNTSLFSLVPSAIARRSSLKRLRWDRRSFACRSSNIIAPNKSTQIPIITAPNKSPQIPVIIAPNKSPQIPIITGPNKSPQIPVITAPNKSPQILIITGPRKSSHAVPAPSACSDLLSLLLHRYSAEYPLNAYQERVLRGTRRD